MDNKNRAILNNEYDLANGKKLTVREAVSEDAQALIAQMKLVDSETNFLAREPAEFCYTLEQEKELIETFLNDTNRLFLVGIIDDNVVANCSVGLIDNKIRHRHRAVLGIVVCKIYWHNGIGNILMQNCIDWCKRKGFEQLELSVVTHNHNAVSMYKKFGFRICGTHRKAMKYSDGTYADEHSMILFLNSANPI